MSNHNIVNLCDAPLHLLFHQRAPPSNEISFIEIHLTDKVLSWYSTKCESRYHHAQTDPLAALKSRPVSVGHKYD